MARVRKFNEPGAKEDRIRWNKAGTRKWLTVYTVMEYHPKAEAKAGESEEKPKASKPKKPKASKAKPKAKPKTSKAKKTAKPKTETTKPGKAKTSEAS